MTQEWTDRISPGGDVNEAVSELIMRRDFVVKNNEGFSLEQVLRVCMVVLPKKYSDILDEVFDHEALLNIVLSCCDKPSDYEGFSEEE